MRIQVTDIGVLFGVRVPKPGDVIEFLGHRMVVYGAKWSETNTNEGVDDLELELAPEDDFCVKNQLRGALRSRRDQK